MADPTGHPGRVHLHSCSSTWWSRMQDEETDVHLSPVAIVGAGAVGTALGRRLVDRGYSVGAVISRRAAPAEALADKLGAPIGTEDWTDLPPDIRLVLLCVPDCALADVARALAEVAHPWTQTIVAHTSGAHTAEVLEPVSERGARSLSVHPLQTFRDDTSPEAFDSIYIAIEGDADALSEAKTMARDLGGRPIVLTAQSKALYHCAAALASNGLVALFSVVEEVLDTVQIQSTDAAGTDFFAPLVDQTWGNLRSAPPEDVLTGPVARGDEKTVETHLDALGDTVPHLQSIYSALSIEMVRTAVRGGKLDPQSAERVLRLLRKDRRTDSDQSDSIEPLH